MELEGLTIGPIRSVFGLGSQTEIVYDTGDTITRKRPGSTEYGNITLKRGYTATSPLWEWRKEVTDGLITKRDGRVIILDELNNEVTSYCFFGTWPVSWAAPKFRSKPRIAIETFELSVDRLEQNCPKA